MSIPRFVNANPILNKLVLRYKGDPVAKDFSNMFEASLRSLLGMKPVPNHPDVNIQKSGSLVTTDFHFKDGESGLVGRASFYYKDDVLVIAVPSVKSSQRGDTYFPKFISGFYEGVYKVVKETTSPIKDIRISGGMVVNRKLKERLPKLGFTKRGMNYSIRTSDYAE